MPPFDIRPKHWYDWINPWWWRRRKITLAVLNYAWDTNGMEKKMNQAIKDAVMYGKGKIEVDWKDTPGGPEK